MTNQQLQPNRIDNQLDNTLVDPNKKIKFYFNGKSFYGFEGDTIASALLANGIYLIGRSFKYHRPRGIVCANAAEPNAIFELSDGELREPNSKASMIYLEPDMQINVQNAWPSANFDIMEINRFLSPILAAGFYYKTFMWPGLKGWMFYEKFIRRAAGLGRAATAKDPDNYIHNHLFCDVLVVGAGVSGMTAALLYADQGKKVILADENSQLGGRLNYALAGQFDGEKPSSMSIFDTRNQLCDEISKNQNIQVMNKTNIFGAYDHGVYGAIESHFTHQSPNNNQMLIKARQSYHKIVTSNVVYATGANERPMLFANNDLPGVMLSEACQRYLLEFGVQIGKDLGAHIVMATINDSVYPLANRLSALGYNVTVVDSRLKRDIADSSNINVDAAITVFSHSRIVKAHGWRHVKAVSIENIKTKIAQKIDTHIVTMSGGFSPNVHLPCHLGKRPYYNQEIDALIIDNVYPSVHMSAQQSDSDNIASQSLQCPSINVGSAAGVWAVDDKIKSVKQAIAGESIQALIKNTIAQDGSLDHYDIDAKGFVDYQHDVSNKDILLANQEGFKSVEHTKRYTTLGMATDQGRLANFNALKLMSVYQKKNIQNIGTTTYRPPYVPISLGALAGIKRDAFVKPKRRVPTSFLYESDSAVMMPSGLWYRAEYHPLNNHETKTQAYIREASAVRNSVGIIDVSTLGKIAVQGVDAAEFINRLYVNGMKKLAVGRIRYGIMLREDGFPFDDGTVMRNSENDFLITTTTAYAADVLAHMEHLLQVVWPDLKVYVNTATDQWASIALAGPNSRKVLQSLLPDIDISNTSLPFMSFVNIELNASINNSENESPITMRIARISFSGELGYELMVPSMYAESLWKQLMEHGQAHQIVAYGTEAMGALRIEKGFITHAEMDGRVTLQQMGMGAMISKIKIDFIGKYYATNRLQDVTSMFQLTGFICDKEQAFSPGYHVLNNNTVDDQQESLGWVSSSTYSPVLDKFIALGFVNKSKLNNSLQAYVVSPLENKAVAVDLCSPQFYDAEGINNNE